MTAHVPMARVPFAPLDNPRLQHLTNVKNRQNGALVQKSLNGKLFDTKQTTAFSPPTKSTVMKRSFDPTPFDEFDSENVDPSVFDSPSKKTKTFSFTLSSAKSMAPPPIRLSTPIKANMSSPRAPMTAPAGRSPKRKTLGVGKFRRVSAPFTRIDPPSGVRSSSSIPFNLDAALNGTFSGAKSAGATIQESMPKNWFFDIYEDTPEEEAANLMEHSTLTLDLSSDEECDRKEKDSRGKENTPPEGYDAVTASRAAVDSALPVPTKTVEIVRRKLAIDEMDDGQRSPLSDLETEPFFPAGCDSESHVIVDAVEGKKLDLKELFAAPLEFTAGKDAAEKQVAATPVVDAEGEVKGDFLVWEDSSAKDVVEIAV